MVKCLKCGSEQGGNDFCIECGSQVWGKCSNCGHVVNVSQKFCPHCGTRNKLVP